MYKTIVFSLLAVVFASLSFGQPKQQTVITTDIDNFWNAYDSIRTTNDSVKQIRYILNLYIDKGTSGLKAFMAAKDYTAESWVSSIRQHPKFWNSIRPNTQKVKNLDAEFEPQIAKLKTLYPELKPANIYFTIGALRSGGTTQDGRVLIGSELATGNAETDISEFTGNTRKFLNTYFITDPIKNIVALNIHEYVHTQEGHYGYNLLSQSIYEGTCDFVTQLVTGKTMPLPYMDFGPQHEAEIREKFKVEMYMPSWNNWLYNSGSGGNWVPDLGYYMGYAICKSYYQNSPNKKLAVKQMILLDYTDSVAVEAFLARSKYFKERLDKPALIKAYNAKRPSVVKLIPFTNGDTLVNASVKEIRLEFSAEMARNTSIDYGPSGKDHFPITGHLGFAADKRSIAYQVTLKPDTEYEFVVNDGFRSADGYPLKTYRVKFKTRK
ncbi:MAG: Ig-like domain-containing protein [Mucilaginibacter sp.]|uniref:Ig-like domain-containing protein n=1 Tax=Mucilaginibacter sp. TaxID=1882438 RepID=UPI00326702A2